MAEETLSGYHERPCVTDPRVWPGVKIGQTVLSLSGPDSYSPGWKIQALFPPDKPVKARLSNQHNATLDSAITVLNRINNPFKTAAEWWQLFKGANPDTSVNQPALQPGSDQEILSAYEARAKYFAAGGRFGGLTAGETNNVLDVLEAAWQAEIQRQRAITALDSEGRARKGPNYDTVAGVLAHRANETANAALQTHDAQHLQKAETQRALKKSWIYITSGKPISDVDKRSKLSEIRAEVLGETIGPSQRQQNNMQEQAAVSADDRAICTNLKAQIAKLNPSLGQLNPEILRLQAQLDQNPLYQLENEHLATQTTLQKLNARIAEIDQLFPPPKST